MLKYPFEVDFNQPEPQRVSLLALHTPILHYSRDIESDWLSELKWYSFDSSDSKYLACGEVGIKKRWNASPLRVLNVTSRLLAQFSTIEPSNMYFHSVEMFFIVSTPRYLIMRRWIWSTWALSWEWIDGSMMYDWLAAAVANANVVLYCTSSCFNIHLALFKGVCSYWTC